MKKICYQALFLLIIAVANLSTGCKKNGPLITSTGKDNCLVDDWKLAEIYSSGTGVNGTLVTPTSVGDTTEFYKPTVLKPNIDQTASHDGYMLRRDVDTAL